MNRGALLGMVHPRVFLQRHLHYRALCEAIVHAFVLGLTEMGLQFEGAPKMQQAARAATAEQSKSLQLPRLVSPYMSKIIGFYNSSVQVWPSQKINADAAKLLHEFNFAEDVSVKQLIFDSTLRHSVTDSVTAELAVSGINLCLDDFAGFDVCLNKAFFLEFNGSHVKRSIR